MNKFKEFLYNIFNKSKIENVYHQNKTSKTVLSATEHLTLNSQTKQKIQDVKLNIRKIAKELEYNPTKILEFIKNSKTNVYYIKNANTLLKIIGENEGFITELNGIKALYLNLLTSKTTSLTTQPIFVLRTNDIDPAIFLHHFYKWYALQMDLPGFDFKTQQNFKKYFKNDKDMNKLQINEILELQEAIARDQEAIDFALDFVHETQGAKNVQKKMIDGGANI